MSFCNVICYTFIGGNFENFIKIVPKNHDFLYWTDTENNFILRFYTSKVTNFTECSARPNLHELNKNRNLPCLQELVIDPYLESYKFNPCFFNILL